MIRFEDLLERVRSYTTDEEREFRRTTYAGGGTKMVEPGRGGGRRRTTVGNTAKISLIQCMPERARFARPDLARFAAGMSVEEN